MTYARTEAGAAQPAAVAADLQLEIDRLRDAVARFRAGALTDVQLRAVRVPMGVYEQRAAGSFMLRARCTGGVVPPAWLERLAEVSATYGNGRLHVTTRQELQVHGVALDAIDPALWTLALAGISTRGGGGNTVRNLTTCADAGVCPEELFDVTPCADAVADHLLPDPRSYTLPRKYKVAFAGCPRDCGGALVNDLGFVARVRDGVAGFAAYVGGGLGTRSRVGELLEEFVSADQAPVVAEAVARVFDRAGNRKDKRRARLRFLVEQLGLVRFRELYEAERAGLAGPERSRLRPVPPPAGASPGAAPAAPADGSFAVWRARCVAPQRQPGFSRVIVPLPLGDLEHHAALALADIARRFGEGLLRATQSQNLALRWVRDGELGALHRELSAAGLGAGQPPIVRDLVACAGAAWCKLGLCQSRGLAAEVARALAASRLDLDALGPVDLRVSGCPDACGRHPVAAIALVGAARRVAGHLVPHYLVQLGGRVGEGRTRLATGAAALPARQVPRFVVELLTAYAASSTRGDFDAFLDAGGRVRAAELGHALRRPADDEAAAAHRVDWGADEPFSLAGRGPGECGAGVFDLIEVDLASAADALRARRLAEATVLAARALLVTRGEQPSGDDDALRLFEREFLTTGLIAARFAPLVADARALAGGAAAAPPPLEAAAVADLIAAVRALYAGMDASLRFAPPAPAGAAPAPGAPASGEASVAPTAVKDLRGVVCPLNYVKTRMALASLSAGEVLAVILDEQGAKNVPPSAAADGHTILSLAAEGDGVRVLIRKGAARPGS